MTDAVLKGENGPARHATVLAAALSWYIFLTFDGETQRIVLMRWIESGTIQGLSVSRLITVNVPSGVGQSGRPSATG